MSIRPPYHKVKLSQTAIARYWQNHVLPQKWARQTKAAELLNQIDCGTIDAATHSAVKQAAYELAITPGSDPKTIKLMYDLCLRAQALDNDARKIALLEERARAAEAAQGIVENKEISDEERMRRIKEVFGIIE